MTAPVPPWARGTLELIVHAESHLRDGNDFDRRMALISFDNAFEDAIVTYLSLHPIQRANRSYKRDAVEGWMQNFHTKLKFVEEELSSRGLEWHVPKEHIVHVHGIRNEQYHGGSRGIPDMEAIDIAKQAAYWIFGILFGFQDVEKAVRREVLAKRSPALPVADPKYSRAIDKLHGMLKIGEMRYLASEVLLAVDPVAYRELGASLCAEQDLSQPEAGGRE